MVVVAVFGKSGLDSGGCKATALELMVGRKIFQRDMTHPIAIDEETMVCSGFVCAFVVDTIRVGLFLG